MLIIWTLVCAAVLAVLLKYTRHEKYKLPPGPRGLPFIGNIFQLGITAPHKTVTEWAGQYGDIMMMNIFGQTVVVLNSFEAIYKGLVVQADQFSGRTRSQRVKIFMSNCPDIAMGRFSPKWVYMKKTAMRVMKMYEDNLANLEVISLKDMINDLRQESIKGVLDAFPFYNKCTTGIISSILFGKKVERNTVKTILDVNDRVGDLNQLIGIYILLDIFPWLTYFPNKLSSELLELSRSMKVIIDKEINERKLELQPDNPECFIDGLLGFQRDSEGKQAEMKLTDAEIYGMALDLFLAGTFSTSTTLNAIVAVLVNKPDIQEQMAAEIRVELGDRMPQLADRKRLHYTEAAILEGLRYSSIAPFGLPHCTMVDTTMYGYDIPKGTEVFYNFWGLHHSPEYWDKPWEFIPERFLDESKVVVGPNHINKKRLMAFGASRRACLGESLAKNRIFLMLTSLLQHFEFLPAGPDDIPHHDPRDYKFSFGVEPYRYKVKLVPRE